MSRRVPGTYRRDRTLFVLPAIPDDAPTDLKNAIALRNACATEGRCPACGTVPELEFDEHGIGHLTFRHEHGCPVLRDDEVAA
jgi:hypothetical protein